MLHTAIDTGKSDYYSNPQLSDNFLLIFPCANKLILRTKEKKSVLILERNP